jgi:tetratricopeptide (TPR) repeat protein
MKTIKNAKKKQQLATYHDLQTEYIRSIPFYLDMSDFFYKQGKKQKALLILSNILELDFENSEYMRAFAFKLLELKFEHIAVWFFERVESLRPFEAQASRDLALSYERIHAYQKALEKHYSILTKTWDTRFSGSKIITINELNHLISTQKLDTSIIDKRLIADIPVGMRIVINWSTDNSDMDLWVIDPNDEKTYYAHRESKIGGKISNDMTRGYGPEEFIIRKAIRGEYQIKVKYFASSAQNVMGETVIRAEIYTDYASKKEKREEIVFRVKEAKEVIDIGKIVY